MRVLFLTTNPNLGSTTRILQSWLLLGRQNGLDARVAVQQAGDFAKWLDSNAVPHIVDSMPLPDRRWPLPGFWHGWRIARWSGKPRVDVIHCNEHDLYSFGLLMRSLLKRPLVCHVRFRIDRPFCEWAFGRAGRMPDALLWTSEQQCEDCAQAVKGIVPPERQHVVRLGLDLERFGTLAAGRLQTRQSWGVQADEIVVGMASAIRPRKRIEDFVELIVQLVRKNPKVVGALAGDIVQGQGDEGYKEKILKQIESAGLGRRLQWLGNLEPIEPFLHGIDIFVSTSEYETFGMGVLEAMACSRPVAAYRGGSVHEVIGDAGRVVDTGDKQALIQAVAELSNNTQVRETLGRQSRKRVSEFFNPAKSLQQLRQIYEAILRQ